MSIAQALVAKHSVPDNTRSRPVHSLPSLDVMIMIPLRSFLNVLNTTYPSGVFEKLSDITPSFLAIFFFGDIYTCIRAVKSQ